MIDNSEYENDEDYKKALEELDKEFPGIVGIENRYVVSNYKLYTNSSFGGGAGGSSIITVYY